MVVGLSNWTLYLWPDLSSGLDVVIAQKILRTCLFWRLFDICHGILLMTSDYNCRGWCLINNHSLWWQILSCWFIAINVLLCSSVCSVWYADCIVPTKMSVSFDIFFWNTSKHHLLNYRLSKGSAMHFLSKKRGTGYSGSDSFD